MRKLFNHVVVGRGQEVFDRLVCDESINAAIQEEALSELAATYASRIDLRAIYNGLTEQMWFDGRSIPSRNIAKALFSSDTVTPEEIEEKMLSRLPERGGRVALAQDICGMAQSYAKVNSREQVACEIFIDDVQQKTYFHRDYTFFRGVATLAGDKQTIILPNDAVEDWNPTWNGTPVNSYGLYPEVGGGEAWMLPERSFGIWRGEAHALPLIHTPPSSEKMRLLFAVDTEDHAQAGKTRGFWGASPVPSGR